MIFAAAKINRLFSRQIAQALNAVGERPWKALARGKAITEGWLAQQLRPYGVLPKTLRIGEERAKGYCLEDFLDSFRRYLPQKEVAELMALLAGEGEGQGG